MTNKTTLRLLVFGTFLSVTGALTVILSGYGYQWDWWHFGTGFSMIPWGTGGAVIGGIIASIGLVKLKERSKNHILAGSLSILLLVAALTNLGYWYSEIQQGYPPIHDITTNVSNPPEFVSIAPLRADAPNPVEYAGEETATAQKAFYSGLETIQTPLSFDEAYDRALETAEEMSWTLVDENRQEGRIEAYEKLAWYGFIDDVVIRVDTTDSGSAIDLRSKSRIGRGDLGVNAKRIKDYIREFNN